MRAAAGVLLVSLLSATAVASPPPPPPEARSADVTILEWSTWLRAGLVVASADEPTAAARPVQPDHEVRSATLAGAFGGGFTLAVRPRLRIGPYAELRDWHRPIVGGELTLLGRPGGLDLFWFAGQSAITLRAGANDEVRTAQVNVSYRAPWDLFGRQPKGSRYVIGASFVLGATQSRTDPDDWAVTAGIELEPVGALRYILGIRSWY